MNKRGFTLIELITTFSLSAVIIIFLINIVVMLKNTYGNTNVKSELLIKQAELSNIMNSKIRLDNLNSYSNCDSTDTCFIFTFVDDEQIKLEIKDNVIKFGDYVYKLLNGSTITTISVTKETVEVANTNANNSFLIIKIPITNKLYPNEDFGINLIYPYNSNKITL